jgi:hypothetical protein
VPASHEQPTIDYDTPRGTERFTRTETALGVTFTTPGPWTEGRVALAVLIIAVLAKRRQDVPICLSIVGDRLELNRIAAELMQRVNRGDVHAAQR